MKSQKKRKRWRRAKEIFEEIMAEDFSETDKKTSSHRLRRNTSKVNAKKITPGHIMLKQLKKKCQKQKCLTK